MILALGPLILLLFIVFLSVDFVYDERYYFNNLIFFNEYGLSEYFIKHLAGPAGPLHALINYPIFSISRSEQPLLYRLLSIVLSLLTVSVLYFTKKNGRVIGLESFLVFACPVFYVCSGLALTESPAILFLCLSVFFLEKSNNKNNNNYIYPIVSGVFLSLSISGRQPFLMVIPAFAISAIYVNFKLDTLKVFNKLYLKTILFCVSAMFIPSWLFFLWGGIVPKVGGLIATKQAYSIINGLLGMGYVTIFIFFIYPQYVLSKIIKNYKITLLSFLVILIVNILSLKFKFYFMNSVAINYLSDSLYLLYGLFGFSVLVALSLFSIVIFSDLLDKNKFDVFSLTCLLSAFFIALTCFKITHQFSSRYVYQTIFLLIPVFHDRFSPSLFSLIINIFGIGLGILSYLSYLS